MIDFDYELSPGWKSSWETLNLREASEDDLLHRVLLGDIVVKVGSHDFSAKWGWVPIVDFAAALRCIVDELAKQDGVETKFDFTESDAVLRFKREGDEVFISASYAPGQARVSLNELLTMAKSFAERVARELSRQFPPLLENKSFYRLLVN